MHALMDMVRDLQADIHANRGGGSVSVDVAPDAFIDHVRNVEATFDDRLAALERTVNSIASEGTRNWSQFADRLKSIDKIAAGSSNTSGLADLVTEQLVAVTDQVRSASDRLARLEQASEKREGDLQRAWTGIGERLRALDENFATQKRESSRRWFRPAAAAPVSSRSFPNASSRFASSWMRTASISSPVWRKWSSRSRSKCVTSNPPLNAASRKAAAS